MTVNPYCSEWLEAEGHRASLVLLSNPHQALTALDAIDPGGIWLTDDVFFHYQRCHRRSFLDIHGDATLRDAPSDYVLKLRQDSAIHQAGVLAEQPTQRAEYPYQNWLAGAAATLELMQQGVERISRGVLVVPLENGVKLVSCPNLLVRQPGHSIFGDWLYVPVDVRLGKRPKLDYQIIAAFHAYVLAAVQGAWTETSWLLLRQRGSYAIDLVELLPRMQELLQHCIQTLLLPQEPEVFISHNRCDLCHWFSHCRALAEGDRHLSLLPGVTPSRYVYLKQLGLVTLEQLAVTNPKQLEPLPGFGAQVAHRLIRQAQATLQNQALTHISLPEQRPIRLSTAELPTAPIELYFDIEASPEPSLIYLYGVLVVDRLARTETFYPLMAHDQQEEQQAWEQLLELFWRYPTAPVFHFCPYEAQTVKRLAEQYGTPSHHIEPLIDRFVDLHERVTRVAILPVESYALKLIARWMGFSWRDPEANGAQSIYWYAQWRETGDQSFLDTILRYNEDDCRATCCIKEWLVDFCSPLIE